MIALPPPAPADVSVISVQGTGLARVTGAGGATVLAAHRNGVVRVVVLRPPGVDAPGPVRLRVRSAGRVRWLARDIAGTPSGRARPRHLIRYCRGFAHGARLASGPPLGADPGTLMRETCRLVFRTGTFGAFTAQTGITVSSGAPVAPTPTPVPTATAAPSATATSAPTSEPTPTPTPTPTPLPTRTGTQLFEYSVHVVHDPLAAGDDEFVVTNSGEDDHELAIRDANGVLLGQTGNLAPRSDPESLKVTLAPGTYTLYCPLYDHEALGMKATVTVN